MNYYNPYFYSMPTSIASSAPKAGLLSRIFGKSGVTFSSILSGTQKVLNVANQAIPLVKQAKPMVNNAKTMFRIMSEFRKNDTKPYQNTNNKQTISNNTIKQINVNNVNSNNYQHQTNGPTFFA